MNTPNYIINSELTIGGDGYMDRGKTLPAGAFVRPINKAYLPKHILEKYSNSLGEYYAMCYCALGIVPIPTSYLREI